MGCRELPCASSRRPRSGAFTAGALTVFDAREETRVRWPGSGSKSETTFDDTHSDEDRVNLWRTLRVGPPI